MQVLIKTNPKHQYKTRKYKRKYECKTCEDLIPISTGYPSPQAYFSDLVKSQQGRDVVSSFGKLLWRGDVNIAQNQSLFDLT